MGSDGAAATITSRRRHGSNLAPGGVDILRHQRRAGTILISPAILAILLISIIPLLAAFYFSFTHYDLLETPQWVGLHNYIAILGDSVFWESVKNTLEFAVSQVAIGLVVATLVAALFNGNLFGGSLMRTLVYLPQAASYVVVALIWNLLLDPAVGPINRALQALGTGPLYFLSDTHWAMPSIVIMSMWRNLGYFMIIILAALKSVPTELLEAAKMDGASAVRRFFSVSLPAIQGVVSFVAITWFLGALQMFTQSYVMTGGGPVNATRTVVYLMYDDAFTNLDIGSASAIAVMLFIIVVILSFILRLVFRSRED
ncbi:MAG: sugar ABC transporter permease [Actinomycetota bacterium]|nr:sugar ABC transporter permease [Actinomycetota bacterium]